MPDSLLRNRLALSLALTLGWFYAAPRAGADTGSGDAVRTTAQRAVPYLEKQGVAWIEKRGCVSCHQVPFMLWSLSAAKDAGLEIDAEGLRHWQEWSVQVKSFVKPAQKPDVDVNKTLASNIDTMNALLLAIGDDQIDRGITDESEVNWRASFAEALVANQNADGAWKACGQLPMQKRPKRETTQVTVLWTLLALAKENNQSHKFDAALEAAENADPVSTEWWVARLLLADNLAEAGVRGLRTRLLGLQRDDGGWGWLVDEKSDAMATGMALYALARTAPTNDADADALAAARRFLIATQRENGSWSVPGTKEKSRHETTPTSNYWGTAWAVIGLLQ